MKESGRKESVKKEDKCDEILADDEEEHEKALTTTNAWSFSSWSNMSTSLLDIVKKDLGEFQHDASEFAYGVGGVLGGVAKAVGSSINIHEAKRAAGYLRDGVANVIHTIDESLQIPIEDEEQTPNDPFNSRVRACQKERNTFLMEPAGQAEEFEKWQANFDLAEQEHAIQYLVECVDEIKSFYTQLVPDEITHNEFWLRYFYRVELIRKEVEKLRSANEDADTKQPKSCESLSDESIKHEMAAKNKDDGDKNVDAESISTGSFQMIDKPSSRDESQDGEDGWDCDFATDVSLNDEKNS